MMEYLQLSKGFKFITNASFKSIDYSEIIRLNNELGGTYYGSSLSFIELKSIRYF